jgi:hypothetical protein
MPKQAREDAEKVAGSLGHHLGVWALAPNGHETCCIYCGEAVKVRWQAVPSGTPMKVRCPKKRRL